MDSLVEEYYREKLILDLSPDAREFTMYENPEWPNFQIVLILGGEWKSTNELVYEGQNQIGFLPNDEHTSSNNSEAP